MDFIVNKDDPRAKALRRLFVFKVCHRHNTQHTIEGKGE